MSEASEQVPPDPDDSTPQQMSTRVAQVQARIDALFNSDNLAQQIYLDRKLTRDQWYEKHADIGFQVIMRKLMCEAARGDGKSAELVLKDLKAWFDKTRTAKPEAADERSAQVQSQLIQRPRAPQDVDDSNST